VCALLHLLCLLGYAPDLREPVGTSGGSAKTNLFFLPNEGRLSPTPPSDSRLPRLPLSPESRDFLRRAMEWPAEEFAVLRDPAGRARRLLEFLIQLLRFYLETELKSARFLREMIWK
ncbi:MAG: DNA repair protein RecO C-terminal domain-containing protein, partial [Candidatus Sumerlaeota bacterium]|nr:DNA repair protein RecO C-terminal domain-containing protein [Candidatus Sumerlaeota bacterium]